ncbi:MAG: dihydroorotase [Gammaproteobacteria bacterium]|nr:dihydroorotase [Gammaproteobacteria bacterium]
MRIHIQGGRVLDPANDVDAQRDVYIADGRILAVGDAPKGFNSDRVINARGHIVCPGLIDMQARLREPGNEHKGTILSETRAAAAAGITSLCCPPDTLPVVDTPAVAELIYERALTAGYAKVLTLGALTKGLEGTLIAEMKALLDVGCVGVSNAWRPITNTLVMRRAMEYAATFDLPVFLHAEDPYLHAGGCAHEGAISTRLGLGGIPEIAETIAVARDLALVEETGARAHFCQLSTARGMDMVLAAQARGLPVTADVSIHHLHLTEMDIGDYNALCHVRPPLRTQRDRDGLRRAILRGVAVCSAHQPHEPDAKAGPYAETEPGIAGLESLLPLTLRLVDDGVCTLLEALASLTVRPARILGVSSGSLSVGADADVCIFDPQREWRLADQDQMLSHGRNTPFFHWDLRGQVTHTLLNGRVVYTATAQPA